MTVREPRRRLTRSAVVLTVVAGALLLVGWCVGLFVIGRHGGGPAQGWDQRVGTWYLTHRHGLLGAAKVVAFVGDAPKLGGIAMVSSGIWFAVTRTIRCLVPVVAYLGGEFQVFAIRLVIHRPRPVTAIYPAPGAIPGMHETSFSFPSGHATAVPAIFFATLGTAAFCARRWWPWLIAALGSIAVADSRLVLGVHWFSDVGVGLVIGTIWGIAVAKVARGIEWPIWRVAGQ